MWAIGGAVLNFLLAIIAFKGGTWEGARPGFRRVTPTGWFAVSVALMGMLFAIMQARQTDAESHEAEKKIIDIQRNFEGAQSQIRGLEEALRNANQQLGLANTRLERAGARLDRVPRELAAVVVDKPEWSGSFPTGSTAKIFVGNCDQAWVETEGGFRRPLVAGRTEDVQIHGLANQPRQLRIVLVGPPPLGPPSPAWDGSGWARYQRVRPPSLRQDCYARVQIMGID